MVSELDQLLDHKYYKDIMTIAVHSSAGMEEGAMDEWYSRIDGIESGIRSSKSDKKVIIGVTPTHNIQETELPLAYIFVEDGEEELINKLKKLPDMMNDNELAEFTNKVKNLLEDSNIHEIKIISKKFQSMKLTYYKGKNNHCDPGAVPPHKKLNSEQLKGFHVEGYSFIAI